MQAADRVYTAGHTCVHMLLSVTGHAVYMCTCTCMSVAMATDKHVTNLGFQAAPVSSYKLLAEDEHLKMVMRSWCGVGWGGGRGGSGRVV